MSENQMIGMAIHITMAIAFLALAIRTRPVIILCYSIIAAANLAGVVRILMPEYANAIEFGALIALLIPFFIGMYTVVRLLAAPPKRHNEPI